MIHGKVIDYSQSLDSSSQSLYTSENNAPMVTLRNNISYSSLHTGERAGAPPSFDFLVIHLQ